MLELLAKLEKVAKMVTIPPTIKYIAVCKASICIAEREKELPAFMRSQSAMTINLWLMPEVAAGFKYREACEKAGEEIKALLGDGFTVGTCPTKSDLIMSNDNFIRVNGN